MTPSEWKALNRDGPVADAVERAVMKALPEEMEAWAKWLDATTAEVKEDLATIEAERLAFMQQFPDTPAPFEARKKELLADRVLMFRQRLGYWSAVAKKRPIDSCPAVKWVWHQCACAATWQKENDPNHLERTADTKDVGEGMEKIQAAIKKLQREMKTYPKLAQNAAAEAIVALRGQGIDLTGNDGKTRPVDQLFNAPLQALYDAVEAHKQKSDDRPEDAKRKRIPGLRAGPFWHRTTHGCLTYSQSLEGIAKLPAADTMLLFAVVLLFRFCSQRDRSSPLPLGQAMPEGGEPNFEHAVEIVTAVFPKTQINSANAAQTRLYDLLRKNGERKNTIGLVDWPHDK